MADRYTVGASQPVVVPGSGYGSQTVENLGPDTVYYAAGTTVSSGLNDGTLAAGSTLTITTTTSFLAQASSAQLYAQGTATSVPATSGAALSSTSYIDLCAAWNNGLGGVAAVTPATPLTVTFNATTTATVTAGSPPASGSIISDQVPAGTTFTASGSTLTLSNAASGSASAPAWAGMDITAALQAALNYFNAISVDGTVEFSKPGVYLINGAQQTGTALGRAYSGQVLFPSRPLTSTSSSLGMRIKGSQPYPGFPGGGILENSGGVILLANAGTGSVFDSIPGYSFGNKGTAIVGTFEDITLRSTSNPQGTAINGTGLAGMLIRGSCSIDTLAPGLAGLTGTGHAIQWPGIGNMAMLHQSGELGITGWPTAMNVGEHLACEYLFIQNALTAVDVNVISGHPVKLNKVCIQNVTNVLTPSNTGAHVAGFFDIGDGSLGVFANDPNDWLYGNVEVASTIYSATETPGLGFPSNGGRNLSVKSYTRPPQQWPSDTFTRIDIGSAYASGPGATDRTAHIWSGGGGSITFPSSGTLKASTGSNPSAVLKYNAGRSNPSRVVRMKVTLGNTGYNAWFRIANVVSGANAGHEIIVQMNAGNINLQRKAGTTTTLATATAAVAANTAYTVDVYISNPYSAAGLAAITVFVNGTQVLTYTLTSTDLTSLSDTEEFLTQDGFGMFGDTTTALTEFSVLPAG